MFEKIFPLIFKQKPTLIYCIFLIFVNKNFKNITLNIYIIKYRSLFNNNNFIIRMKINLYKKGV